MSPGSGLTPTDWMRYSTDVENNFEIVIPSNTSEMAYFTTKQDLIKLLMS